MTRMATVGGTTRTNGRVQQYSPPTLRENNVIRAGCIERMREAGDCSIVVIVAGAGCGKSTLLRQIYDELGDVDCDRIWIALDERDENVEQFGEVLATAISALEPALAIIARDKSGGVTPSYIPELAAAFSDSIRTRKRTVALFLDDYQFAAEGDSAKLIQTLIRLQPSNLKIFIASRIAPKFEIESLKVENRLVDFSWRELAFSKSETARFFQIAEDDANARLKIEALHRETEGWAAGLQLALMKTRLTADAAARQTPASAYASDIGRYFRTEIFEALPDTIQDFLVKTSALDRFNSELAAAVADVSVTDARKAFDFLHSRGFFLIALEGEGRWLRYHHLVKEYLSEIRSERQANGAAAPELTASLWFEKNAQIPDAIEYAIRGSDFDRASDLVEDFAIELFNKGAATELAAWISRIPNKIIVKRPQLPLYLCKIYAHMRQPIEGLRLQYERCKQVISTLEAVGHFKSEEELNTLLTELDVSGAIIKFRAGDMEGVIESGATILERNHPIRTTFSASLHNIMGYAHFILGDNGKARASLTTARDLHLSARSVFGVVFAEAFKGMVSLSDGTTTGAKRHFAAALDHAVSELGVDSLPASIARLYLNVFRYEVNEPIDFREFEQTLAECRFCCEPEIYANALVTKYHLISRSGQPDKAREALADATAYAREIGNDLIYLQVRYTALQHELNRGSMPAAVEIYADAQALWSEAPANQAHAWNRRTFWRDLFCAEMLLATAQPRKAAEIYQDLARISLKHNRVRRHVLVLSKLAAALAGAGQTERAVEEMLKALRVSKPSRFVRTLLDSGPRANDLIRICGAQTDDIDLKIYIDSLLGVTTPSRETAGAGRQFVLDELSPKEIEVLRILTTGAKNKEICEKLQITENTVKWHMSRIFQKLGAANRTEAAMIAKSVFASL